MRATWRLTIMATVLLAAACGGSGGGSSQSDAIDLGLVSGSQITIRTIAVTNPMDEAALVTWPSRPSAFSVNAADLPASPVLPGAEFSVRISLVPTAPGELLDSVRLIFRGLSGADQELVVALRALVEEVTVISFTKRVDFGVVAFGDTVDRQITVSNQSSFSNVTFTGLSAINADLFISDPPLPFDVAAGSQRTVTIRSAPWTKLQPFDGPVTLRSSTAQGNTTIELAVTPAAGRKVIDLGLFDVTDGRTPVITFDVPENVWSVHVSAWRPGHLMPDYFVTDNNPLPQQNLIAPILFEGPNGSDHRGGWFLLDGTFAATLPNTTAPADQPQTGRYRLQLEISDFPPPDAQLRVSVVIKAAIDGVAPTAGTLDLNVWLGSAASVTAATAATDARLQNAIQTANMTLQQVGIAIGNIDYYDYTEVTGGARLADELQGIRAAMPLEPGIVKERINFFCPSGSSGRSGGIPGAHVAYTNSSFTYGGYDSVRLGYILAHEVLHYMGLWHVPDDALSDTVPGSMPTNIMDFTQGTFISPNQGVVVRAHPAIR